MGKSQLTTNEKELLTILGAFPDISMTELVDRTQYKRLSSVVKKIRQLEKRIMFHGPFHDIDFGKLCKNPVHMVTCIIESRQSFETVISYLRLIEPLKFVYPVLSPHKKVLDTLFVSSDDRKMISLFQLLKDSAIITDYIVRPYSHNRVVENPNFFRDPNPSLENLLDPCDVPDLSFGCHNTNWNECDISILSYVQVGYNGGKLIEILKAERKLNRKWKYDQIKYSHKKMVRNGLITKRYFIYPFSYSQCADFNAFLKTEDKALTKRILCNFARGERVLREWVLCGEWGYIGFASHPLFLTGLMHKLGQIDEIKEKELYQIYSIPDRESFLTQPPELKYFDLDKQTLEYPYGVYRERIKEKLEEM